MIRFRFSFNPLHLIVAFFIFCTPFIALSNAAMFIGGESSFGLLSNVSLNRSLTTWDNSFGLGIPSSSLQLLPMNLIFYVLEFILPMYLVQKVVLSILISGAYLGMTFVIRILYKKSSFGSESFAGLLYIFNPYSITMLVWAPIYQYLFFCMPLLFLCTHSFVSTKITFKNLLCLFIFWFISSPIAVNPALFGLLFIYHIAHITYYSLLSHKAILRVTTLILTGTGIAIVASSFWLLPFLFQIKSAYSNAKVYQSLLDGLVLTRLPMVKSFGMNLFFFFDKLDNEGLPFFSYAPWYGPISILCQITLFILLTIGLINQKINSEKIIRYPILISLLQLILIGGLFLSKGTWGVFGSLYKYFLQQIGPFGIYRASDIKFPVYTMFAFAALSPIYTLVSNKFGSVLKTAFMCAILAIPLFYGSPFILGKHIQEKYKVTVPKYWIDLSTYIAHHLSGDSRVLLYPKNIDHFDRYTWGYEGGWLSTYITNISSLGYTLGYGPSQHEHNFKAIRSLYKAIDENRRKDFLSSLTTFGIDYILVRSDFYPESKNKRSQHVEFMLNAGGKVVWSSGELMLVSVRGTTDTALIERPVSFINPTTYVYSNPAECAKNELLVLKQSYDENWILLQGMTPATYQANNAPINKVNLALLFLSGNTVDAVHTMYRDYGNQWEVSARQNQSCRDLYVVYKPEFFRLFGVSITGLSFVILIIFTLMTYLKSYYIKRGLST